MKNDALSPWSQAAFHFGCTVKHGFKTLTALWAGKISRGFLLVVLAIVFLTLFSGCASTGGGWNPLSAWFGRKAAAEAKAEAKAGTVEDATVQAAQVEVVKTGVALDAAAIENPESRAVEVAKRTNTNAKNLLNQRAPLTVKELEEAVATVNGLLSVETALREKAERSQAAVEKENRATAEELGGLRADLKRLGKERAEEAQNNLRMANQLRVANIWKWSATAGSLLLGIAAFAYKANLGNFQGATAELLGTLRKKDEGTANLATGIFDAALNKGQQNQVAKILFSLNQNASL